MSESVTIPGAPHNPYRQIDARYSYDGGPTKCPACGGSGILWAGWFHCDSDFTGSGCYCVAVIADGRAFVPAPQEPKFDVTPLAPPMAAQGEFVCVTPGSERRRVK